MTEEKLKDLYLNWKGLEFMHSAGKIFNWIIIILSLIFMFISLSVNNYYVFGVSLIFFFLQISSNGKKDYYLKYKEVFEKINSGKKIGPYNEWIKFLENTSGLNSFSKGFFGLFFNSKFKKIISSNPKP